MADYNGIQRIYRGNKYNKLLAEFREESLVDSLYKLSNMVAEREPVVTPLKRYTSRDSDLGSVVERVYTPSGPEQPNLLVQPVGANIPI